MHFISVGKVVGSFGLNGEIKVKPITDHPEIYEDMEYLLLTQENELKRSFNIENLKFQSGHFIFKVKSIDTEMDANKLKGLSVSVTEDMLPENEDDEVYWFEIEGCPVFNEDNIEIGKLDDVLECGSNDVFRIALNNGKYALISNNKNHVLEINTKDKKVIISEQGLVDEEV